MTDKITPVLLKDILGPQALTIIADAGVSVSTRFDRASFLGAASDGLSTLSIMERVRHIADALYSALPAGYVDALEIIRAMAPQLTHGFQAVAVTEFVARYGRGDFDRSMEALTDLTRFGSAEFAIRPFLAQDTERTLTVMKQWTSSTDEHVRRLASEGSRPRLPWASRIPSLMVEPTRTASILEALKADPSAYVRKSVANHLNDIAKGRPDWLLDRLAGWSTDNPDTAWIIRHALRTLIKKGEPRALALIGAGHGASVTVRLFSIEPQLVRLGDTIAIDAELVSTSPDDQRLVVDYRVNYARAGGKTAAKVFKLRTLDLSAGKSATLGLRQAIRDFSTRRHHPGHHEVELIVNGVTMASTAFEITSDPAAA
ncbi:MAG: DNA alkylation repair protein [Sphingobium sp.]|uniref:DNA alkylation repair protein n=1 Tax=Sphingobium sp. TaxID=1912891 RepID=UPI00299FD9ED|nr:DNA alkylation repair protein [Sphingobium sp.]MDX3911108.1 DNA alkylation repair protein [Sphingobium sp.]